MANITVIARVYLSLLTINFHMYNYCNINILYRKQVEASLVEAKKDGVTVPQTIEEYTASVQKKLMHSTSSNDYDDLLDYDDDYMQSTTDEEGEGDEEEAEFGGEEDSGMA